MAMLQLAALEGRWKGFAQGAHHLPKITKLKRSSPANHGRCCRGKHADHTSKFSSSGPETCEAFEACSFACIREAHRYLTDYFEVFSFALICLLRRAT